MFEMVCMQAMDLLYSLCVSVGCFGLLCLISMHLLTDGRNGICQEMTVPIASSSVIIVSTCVDYVQDQGRFCSALAPSPDPPQASG